MKLRFRIAAICLAALLMVGVMPSGLVYADDQSDAEQTEQADLDSGEEELALLTDSGEESPETAEPEEATEPEETEPEATLAPDLSQTTTENDPATTESGDTATEEDPAAPETDPEADPETETEPEEDALASQEPALEEDELEELSQDGDSDTVSVTLKNTVLDVPEGATTASVEYTIFLWEPTLAAQGSYDAAITGTYGGVWFSRTKVYSTTAANINLPYLGSYYYNYYYGYGYAYYGQGTVYLAPGESVTLELPAGCGYFIYQDASDIYYIQSVAATTGDTSTFYGTVSVTEATSDNVAEFTDVYAPNSLRIEEEVSSSDPESVNQEFTYTVYFYKKGSTENQPLFDEDNYTIEVDAFGIDGAEDPDLGPTMTLEKSEETLTGMTVSGTYNKVTFKLKHGQNVVFKNLGMNVGYYIKEDINYHYALYQFKYKQIFDASGADEYTYSYDNWYIYIDDCSISSHVGFLNTQLSLSITKQVENSDTTRDFLYTVNFIQWCPDEGGYRPLTDGEYTLSYTGSKGDYTETLNLSTDSEYCRKPVSYTLNGTACESQWAAGLIRLAAGQTVTIMGLPSAVLYYISEVSVDNYTVSSTANYGTAASANVYYTGRLMADEAITYTNTYVEPEGIDLTLTEAVTGRWADEDKEFLFTITLADQEGAPLSEYDITTKLPSGTETICTTSDSGVLTFRLKHGQSVVLRDLPKGTSYTITQSEVGSYGTAFTVTGGSFDEAVGLTQSGVLNTEEDGLVEVLNDLGVRDLTVTETVTGNVGDQNKVFPFTVTFTDQAGVPLSGQAITVLLPGETEAVTHTTDAKGTLTFSLKHGQAITFRELPQDICYTITQTEYGDYSTAFTVTGGSFSEPEARAQSGALDGAGNAEVQVVNNLEARNLTITKTVTGNMGERARDFTFTVTLTDQAGDPLGNLDIQTLLPDNTTTVYTTDAKGVVTVTIRHGQSLTLQYLPDDTRYTIAETGAEKYTTTFAVAGGSYTPTKSQTLKGAIDKKTDVTVDVTNDYEVALPTGVTLDTKPFVLLTAGCLGAALVLAQRRRRKLR